MDKISTSSDSLFNKYPHIQGPVGKVRSALSSFEQGKKLPIDFLSYAYYFQSVLKQTNSLRKADADLDDAMKELSQKVKAVYAKIAPLDLLRAIQENDVKLLQKVLKVEDVSNKELPNGQMPLHLAIRLGKTDVIKYFISSSRLDPNIKDNQGLSAIDHAYLSNNVEVQAIFWSAILGAEISSEHMMSTVNEWQECQKLLNESSLFRNIGSTSMLPPICAAALFEDLPELQRLYAESKGSENRSSSIFSPIHSAAIGGKSLALKFLIEKGEKPDAKMKNGMNALHLAAMNGSEAVIMQLLETKLFDLNAPDGQGRTPLHFAMAAGHLGAARCLIKAGGDPFIQTFHATPFAILNMVSKEVARYRDPLKLYPIVLPAVSLAISCVSRIYSNYSGSENFRSISTVFGALPVFSVLPLVSSKVQKVFGGVALSGLMSGYQSGDREVMTVAEGTQAAFFTYNFWDQVKICWKNRHLEWARPARNLLVHGSLALFSGWKFLEASGLQKDLVCRFGSIGQCFDFLKPQMPRSYQQCSEMIHNEANFIHNYCSQEQDPSCSGAKDFQKVCRNVIKDAQGDAKRILSFGGYPSVGLNEAKNKLDEVFQEDENLRKKVSDAFQLLETSNSCQKSLRDLPDLTSKLQAMNPKCQAHLQEILGNCTTKDECKKTYRKIIKKYHPDKFVNKSADEKDLAVRITGKLNQAFDSFYGSE